MVTEGEQQTDGNASFLRAARAGNLEKVLDYLKGSIDINTSNANGLNALHLAAKEGHVNVVSELLKRGANVNATTKKGNSALHIASLAGQEEVVKLLVQKQANVNVQSQNGFTPLYMAAQENHDGVVRFLLANGANQSLATEDGFTPLAVALQQGHDKVVAVLLENDARGKVRLPALHIASKKDDCKAAALLLHSEHNPDVTSKSGFTPLHIAAHYGNSNIASLLLEKGADVNFPAKHQITPLHVAAKWGKSNMVKLLLEKGAKIDASTRDGLTPLHCAARSGHDQVVEQLLEKNAPITAKTKNGLAPLHMASQGDHVDSARILLYHKAPVDDVTVDYLTALHVAAHCGHVGVAKLLLDRRADPNARALNGFTPLHIACKKNRIKVVELLLKHGASIEATTESGLTPLHVASFMGCMNIVIYLIQHGANPDIPTVRGETPLHLAARANQTDIIRILLRNGAHVDAKARELQTALHIASRLGNADMVGLLLQHGAAVDAPTKDAYTPLHVAAREGQDEVAALLLDHGAALAAPTKKGFTPLHLAAKYGNLKVAQLLLQKDAPVDAQGKNGVTPLHVAAHYDHVNVALLLLEKGASPHSAARNGYTPLHVAARKDQMDIASSLLEYGAKPGAESRAGFTPLHLAAQEGHADLAALLVEHGADCDAKAKNGLTPMHLCAQEDRVEVATILAKHGASLDPTTKAGYTPLHVACHFGQTNMIRFLLRQGANVNATTSHGYTPLHQAAQQGHTLIINLLLEHRAAPNAITNQGQTALAIAQRLGYISVVETLKVVTETIVTTTTTTVTEEKYRVVAPETMHETFMSDSEDEAAEDNMLGDQSFRYLTADEMKSLGDDSLPIDVTRDERITESIHIMREPGHSAPLTQEEERLSPTQAHTTEAVFVGNYAPDNVDLSRTPIHAGSLLSWDGDSCSSAYVLSPTKRMWRESSKLKWKTFLVSFMVDARGGAMRGCRHSGVRVIIPPRKAQMPMRITCRYLRKEKLPHPPPLLEGEACASRILEVGPAGAKFLGPVILEVPHFASLRGKEREISILRSDNGETWKEHTLEASEEAVQEVLNESFEGEELSALEDLQTNRIVRILTTDFPQYFAVVSRTRQEVHAVGPEGGLLSSTVVPQVQAIFPEGALTKKIRVGLQAQPIPAELVTKLLGHRVAVSPIVTVEPRRRKFHKPITLTIPVPQAATKGMINQYAGDAPTLRLLCSITGGTNKAQWEDVTGSTPLTFVNDCVSFTTTVSARFWLMDCRQVSEATKFATELYAEAMHVPFMAKFVVFAKRLDPMEAQLRVFCMTDDKEDKTLESQEHFTEVAKSRDVEVLEKKSQYLEFGGNLVPVTKSGEQLQLQFQAFRENRLPFSVRVKDPHQEPLGRLAFMRQPRAARATEPPQAPLCNLNIALPEYEATQNLSELVTLEKKYGFVEETGLAKPELIHRADLRLSDIARELGSDWPALAAQLDVPEQDVASIRTECPSDLAQQALLMLRLWMKRAGGRATGNNLEKGLRMINREDIVNKCMFNVELVTDDVEKAVAKVHLDQSGFDTFREELGTPKDTSLKRDASLDVSYDEQDLMKAESAEETSSETGSVHEKHTGSEAKDEPLPKAMGLKTKPSEETVVSSTQVKGIHDNGTVKHTVTTVTKTTIIQEVEEPAGAPRPGESETWASDLDTSQVSVSSLPEDERTEPTLSSSATTATADAEALSGPLARTQVEEKEWTETDPDSGEVRHIISKTTHTTVTSVKPGEGAPRGDTMSTSVSQSSKGGHGGSAASAPSSHDEAESLTFCQKKEFFEKLSEQSPLQETFSSRLGSTPSLDTALTRPVVTVKPRPRSESLTSQGEIIEENIVFAERLRLFQNGAQASSSPGASLPHLDLMDQRRQSRDQRLQGLPEMTDSLQPQSSEVFAGLQDTDGKSDTRLLVHTSDADKEAFDVCSVQSSEDVGDQQFSRMRVRMPATEECVSETLISSCDLPGEKPSPLRDAYKDSLTPQQEGSHTGKPSQPAALSDNSVCLVHEATTDLTSKTGPPNQTNKDLTVSGRQPFTEHKTSLLSSQSHMLASGLQMGVVAGSGILQKGIEASAQSAIFETLSSSPTELKGLDSQAMSELPPNQGLTRAMEQARGKDMGKIGAVVAAAPIAVLPAGDIISGKQIEMLDISHVSEESNLFEMCADLPDQVEISQPSAKEKTMMKTEYADIQHKLSSAFGESRAAVDTKGSVTRDVPKEVLAAFDRSNQEFAVTKSEEDSEHGAHILDISHGLLPHDFIPGQNESMLHEETAEQFVPDTATDTSISLESTHVRVTTKELEIHASKEFVEEQGSDEKLESLVALSTQQDSKLKERDDDSYDRDIKEFIAVLEDQETFPVPELSEWRPSVTAYEPHVSASEIDSKCVPEKNKKEDEAGSSVQDAFEISEYHDDDSHPLVIGKKSGVFIGGQERTEEHETVSKGPDYEESSTIVSEPSFGVEKEMHLDSSDIRVESSSQLGTVSPKQPCEEHSSDITVSSEGEQSLIVEDVSVPPKSSAIDTQISSDSAATKDEAVRNEITHPAGKMDELPLSFGASGTEFPQQAPEITTDTLVKAVDSDNLHQDELHFKASTGHHEGGSEIPYSSDEDQQKELSRYKEVELAIPFLRGGSSSLEDEAEDGGSFSSADLQAEKIAEFLTTDSSTVSQVIHFPQIFQDHDITAQKGPAVSTDTTTSVEKRVGFVLDEKTVGSPPCVQADRQAEIEEASRIVESVVHIASTFVESLNEVAPEASLKEDTRDNGPSYAVGSPPERSEVSETLSQGGLPSAIEKDHKESLFGVKEMYEVLKESRVEDRVHYSVTSLGDPLIADEADEDQERRRRGSPTAESLDDQAQIEKCSREVMMQLLDGFSQSDVELAEVRTEDEAPDIEDDVPSPEAGSQEEKSVPSSQDNSGDLQPQLSTEVEIGSQASGAPAPLSELDYELCPDADQLRTSGDEAVSARVPPLEPERDAAVAESSHAPSAAADPATSAGRSAGGRERSPLLEASPPEETAYCPAQDISPAQEYPEYLTPDMQVRVGVSPTEAQPAKEKPVRYSESSVESSSEVGSPCPPSQGGTAMAFENVAFAGEDVIDATSSPVEESSSPTGSRSPYEVVRDAPTEETAEAALLKAEKSLHHVMQEVRPRPQSLVAEECNEQIEQLVKPTIFNEAFDHSPKEIAPEKKELSEGLLGVGLLTVSDMTARTPESRRGDSDEDEEEWADHVMSKIRGRPIPPTPPASPRAVQSVEVHDEQVTWEVSAAEQEEVHRNLVSDMTANEETVVNIDESAAVDDDSTSQPQLQEVIRSTDGKRPQLEHIPSEISDEDLVEREQSPTHITATCRGDRKDSSSDRNSSPDSDGPKACGSHRRSASGVGAIVLESGETQKGDSSDKYSQESRDQGAQEFEDKITEEPQGDMFVIEEEALVESSRSGLSYDDGNETGTRAAGTLSPDLDSPPKKKDGDDGSSSGKLDAASPVVLRSKSKRTEQKSEKRSSRDMDTGHSGSETDHSHYYSFEMTSDSAKTPGASRPTSSEFDINILSGQASSEYETCATSQDGEVSGSYATAAASSHDTSFATARSSLSGSSRGSAYSVDSESSGHLGSMEVSEASETIVASAHEELDSDNESERSKSVLREPYDGEIPESVIRGGVEHPFLPSWQPVAKEATPKLDAPVGARPSSSEAALSQVHSAVPAEPGRSCTGWPSASSSTAQGDTSRSTSKAEILNGTGSSASLDGQRRLRHNDDYMASSHEEEQLSVSESSATQSEHTWQTSVETMVDAVEAQRLSCERERNHRQSTIQNSVSLPFDDVVAEGAEADRNTGDDRATPPFQEVNGPVEVEYMPEYDDLTARTLRSVLEENVPEGQTEVQGAVATPEASHGEGLEVSSSRELDEQEDSTELREEGFYAETFQGDLSSEEVESAADVGLLQGRSACSSNAYCDKVARHLDSSVRSEVKNISLMEPFDRPATPEPVDEVDGEDHKANTSQRHLNDDNGDMFRHVCAETPMCHDKTEIKQDCPEDDRCNFLAGSGSYSIQDQPRSESASSSPGRDTADDVKLYTSKCEDYILQMHQTYKYGVGLSNTSDGSSYLPEEGMDVENVKLLASRLQEGNGSQQDFPYDLSYEHEYVGDVRAEHGDLYTHQEVEEEAYDDERTRMRGRRRLSPISDERGSTPDYDTLGGRKTFGKGSEKDDASTSSLMEFERLEAEMASGAKSSSVGSSDSFSGRQHQIRNGTGSEQDSVSVNSLTEFERLEKEIVEAEGVDTRLRGEAVPKLDEIDEGHESQASDPGHETTVYDENGITLLREAAADSGVKEEYDRKGDDTHLEEILTSNEQEVTLSRTERHFLTTRTESGHSVDSVDRQSSASTATQFDADSLRDREIDDSESNFGPDTPGWTQKECTDLDSLHDSLHDSERYDSLQEALSKDKDSLQLREPSAEADSLQDDCNELQDSLYEARDIEWDSVRTEDDPSHNWHQFSSQIRTTELSPTLSRPASSPLVVPVVVERIDTLTWVDQDPTKAFIADEESLDRPQDRPRTDALVSSTDSLEPSSSANTHATYQCDTDSMMSSLNSAEESTMVSSTDTLDHEALHFASSGKPFHLESSLQMEGDITDEHLDYATTDPSQNKQRPAVGDRSADDIEERFRECLLRSATSPTDEEQVEERQTIDEKGNLIVTRTVKRHVTSEPRLHAQTFAGPDAEQRSREFVASFSSIEPSSEKDECEGFDAAGNAVRVTQHVLVRPIVKTVTFTGPDAQLQMREYMRNLAGGQQSSAENTPTSDSGVGVCSSLASPPPLVPDPPATAPSSACPGLQRLSGGDHWMEAESALDDSSRPVTATRVITTRTTRTVGPDGREQLVTTTTEEGAGGDEPELRLRRSMQGVLDSFMADPSAPPPHSDEE